MRRPASHEEHGFTLVEVIVAMVVLVIGLGGAMALVDQANSTTTSNKAREQATALQRELVESARSVPYAQLTPTSVVGKVRETPGFVDCASAGASASSCSTMGASGWTVTRRGITFRVTVGVCSVDNAGDKLGQHDAATFCATGGGAATSADCRSYLLGTNSVAGNGQATGTMVGDCGIDLNFDGKVDKLTESETGVTSPSGTEDTNPDDYKRIVTLVRWDRGTGTHYALQSTTIPYPGLSGAPRVTTPVPQMADPVISGTTAKFTVGTDRPATSVAWFVSGTPGGSATDMGGATSWAFTWDLGNSLATARTPARDEVLDGTYNVGARAVDRYGSAGPTRWYTLRINRRAPYAPAAFQAVRQDNVVWLRWAASPEGDVEGAEVYREDLAAPVCALSRATSCADTNLPSSGTVSYYVRASDRDPAGALRKGDETAHLAISMDNRVPDRPINLTAVRSGTQVTLSWLPPPNGDPDLGDTVTRYRVFRDGTAIGNRYWESSAPTTLTFTDTSAADGQHQYYVVAVDTKDAESKPQGPVTA